MTDLRRIEIHALLTRYRDRCREFGAASHLARTTAEKLGEAAGEIWDAWEAAEREQDRLHGALRAALVAAEEEGIVCYPRTDEPLAFVRVLRAALGYEGERDDAQDTVAGTVAPKMGQVAADGHPGALAGHCRGEETNADD